MDIPLGKELSGVKGVSIIRVTDWAGHSVQWNPQGTLDRFSCEGDALVDVLQELGQQGHWYAGVDLLPDGYYKIKIDTPQAPEDAFRALRDAVGQAFDLTITVKPHKWQGYRITVPDPLPTCFQKTEEGTWSMGTGGKGFIFKNVEFETVQGWLEETLGAPTIWSRLPDGLYTFEVDCSVVFDRAATVKKWFEGQGFKFKDTDIGKPTVVIERK
jgi:hypothetical protein